MLSNRYLTADSSASVANNRPNSGRPRTTRIFSVGERKRSGKKKYKYVSSNSHSFLLLYFTIFFFLFLLLCAHTNNFDRCGLCRQYGHNKKRCTASIKTVGNPIVPGEDNFYISDHEKSDEVKFFVTTNNGKG